MARRCPIPRDPIAAIKVDRRAMSASMSDRRILPRYVARVPLRRAATANWYDRDRCWLRSASNTWRGPVGTVGFVPELLNVQGGLPDLDSQQREVGNVRSAI